MKKSILNLSISNLRKSSSVSIFKSYSIFTHNKYLRSNHLVKISFSNFSNQKAPLTTDRYLEETHKLFEYIYDRIDNLDLQILENIDLTEGVLNIKFKLNRYYVINIQRPNLQIWLSSPISGPQRFQFDQEEKIWKNIRNSKNLVSILNDEINQILKENNEMEIKL